MRRLSLRPADESVGAHSLVGGKRTEDTMDDNGER